MAKQPSKQSNPEPDELQPFNFRAWYGVLGFCIIGLGILGYVSRDVSVRFYVMWAIALLCFAPELDKMMTAYTKAIEMIDLLKYEERKRMAVEEKKKRLAAIEAEAGG